MVGWLVGFLGVLGFLFFVPQENHPFPCTVGTVEFIFCHLPKEIQKENYLTYLRLKAVAEITSKVAKSGELSSVKNLLALFIHHVLSQGS